MEKTALYVLLPLLQIAWGLPHPAAQENPSSRPHRQKQTLFSEPLKTIPGPEKTYTGYRVTKSSQLMAYHHEQTVAVVELGPARKLLNCEILEVKTGPDKVVALKELKKQKVRRQAEIRFKDMLDVQKHCQAVDPPENVNATGKSPEGQMQPRSTSTSLSSVFIGIFPGTKWCGRGDIAQTYYDLGEQKSADKCCRTHDLCPVKVAAMRTQYNITNYSMVTRSHCSCDEAFLNCLKENMSSLTDLIGSLYFNVGDLQCVDDLPATDDHTKPGKIFRPNMLRY